MRLALPSKKYETTKNKPENLNSTIIKESNDQPVQVTQVVNNFIHNLISDSLNIHLF